MRPTLADSLELMLPNLASALVSPDMRRHLRELARGLAPIPNCGFEVQLTDSNRVDLQQCILASEGEPQRLRSHLQAQWARQAARGEPVDCSWQLVDGFLGAWCDQSSNLHKSIEDLWLEFDQTPTLGHSLLPVIFFGFRPAPDVVLDASAGYEVAQEALDALLGRPAWMLYEDNLRQCFEACRAPAFVSHLGVMPARGLPALRVNVKNLSPDQVSAYLEGVAWPGVIDEAVEKMARLYGFVDRLTVCLDVGERVYPQLGFECIVGFQPPLEPRWATFLDYLVDEGWCSAEKRDALLEWPGLTYPNNAGVSWPDHMIHDALLHPADRFTALERRISHIKIVWRPQQQRPEAKAYFGFLHRWLQPETDQNGKGWIQGKISRDENTRLAPVTQTHGTPCELGEDELGNAIHEAITFLLEARNADGWWYDFPGEKGGSDGWVTAFVGALLAHVSESRVQQAVQHAWSLLNNRLPDLKGWGYSRWLPVDADSTAWGLRLASAAGFEASERAQQARQVLALHLLPNGGLTSYREEALPLPINTRGRLFYGSRDGWCRTAHTCVTAGAAVLADERLHDFLRLRQRDDGSWEGYWWEDSEYSTALAAEALARTGCATDRSHVEAAVEWALQRIGSSGAVYSVCHGDESAFATAWCVRILTLSSNAARVREPMDRAVQWLLRTQLKNGAWPFSARLRVPFPDVVDPDKERHAVYLDEVGVFTAVIAVNALEGARSFLYGHSEAEPGQRARGIA
jgi:hypothetical protein